MRKYIDYLGPRRKILYALIVLGMFISILSIIGPQLLGMLTDQVADCIEQGTVLDPDSITYLAVTLVILYLSIALLESIYTRTEWITEERVGDDFRRDLSEKISRLPVGTLDRMETGDIMSRFVNDTESVRHLGIECITRTAEMIIMLIGCIVIMFITEWRLALAALLPTFLGFLIIRVIIKFSQKYYRAQSRNLGKMNNIVEETYRGDRKSVV